MKKNLVSISKELPSIYLNYFLDTNSPDTENWV